MSQDLLYQLEDCVDLIALIAFQKKFRESGINSIDHFLSQNPDVEDIGRYAITAVLSRFEDPSKLYGDWYQLLWNHLLDLPEGEGQKLSIVTFNYDRSLEFFLFRSLKHTLSKQISLEELRTKLDRLVEIVHVYGDIGDLPELSNGPRPREYGQTETSAHSTIDNLRLIGRQGSGALFERAKELIGEAHFVCFLGFGFLEENIVALQLRELFAKTGSSEACALFSSAYGLGRGMQGRLATILNKPKWFFGDQNQDALSFLSDTDFFGWAGMVNGSASQLYRTLVRPHELR